MEQINSRGQALEDGLDVFIPVSFLSGEYVSYGSSFIPSTLSVANIETSTVAYATEAVALANLPTYNGGSGWFRFSSNGTSQTSVTPPISVDNIIKISSATDAGVSSISGVFQELKQLYAGAEYSVSIKLHQTTNIGTLKVSTVYNSSLSPFSLIQSEISSYTLPSSELTFNFKANGISDIIFISFESTISANLVDISSISVKEVNLYKMPVVTEIPLVGISKVLRRKFESGIPLEKGEPPSTND